MKQERPGPQDGRPNQVSPRKLYHKPVLEVYGDLAEITLSLMNKMAMQDGASHPNKHFTQ